MLKIGVTERGDAALDLSWSKKLDKVDGAILITKNVNEQFKEEVMKHKDKVIVHCTCTGLGGTVYEPNVPTWQKQISNICDLVSRGFPSKQVVIRIDPLLPTNNGMLDIAEQVVEASSIVFKRCRISLVDMYPHVRNRFLWNQLLLPYGDSFYPSPMHIAMVDCWVRRMKKTYGIHVESCAEGRLKETEHIGCVSEKDCNILGLDAGKDMLMHHRQRRDCMCIPGKVELLNDRHPCKHNCVYCYWKKEGE